MLDHKIRQQQIEAKENANPKILEASTKLTQYKNEDSNVVDRLI